MTPTLYFLRSSEEKIVQNMLKFTHDNDKMYADFFGHSNKDLGLYALLEHTISGAIWCRQLKCEQNAKGFIDEQTPILHVVVLEEFRGRGIGTFMMEQFLQEAAALYAQISVHVPNETLTLAFYEKFGFVRSGENTNEADKTAFSILIKKLEKKEIIRPSDGYDPTRWMD
ncbi:MAG: GNAT family N-acetyltransferase [Sulfurimonas sp.]|jgi:ribosomal protein S18 acetylase RimI-like enzyme|nr:GNAT family N-acetyltransferase [Sulfurimonas sp.]MBU3939456.1 GNAT family N-acetyltransferase [bacterium]MBU4058876.1 GNAT family N-acetyltransferase [bacterium]MBU4111553.1 GNAT family N-acetyltransferase [bacterium]